MAKAAGTLNYDTTGGEQTMVEMDIAAFTEIGGIYIDLDAILTTVKIMVYVKIDGTNYRPIGPGVEFPANGVCVNLLNALVEAGVVQTSGGVAFLEVDMDLKITVQEVPA
jgi:hypothetical protein